MKLSLKWLSEHVDLTGIAPEDVASILTRSTCEVEAVDERFAFLEGVIAARIVKRAAHPNADRLSLCTVDTGTASLSVVCGAPNAEEGLVVPLARPGTRLPGVDGFFEIKAAKIRGVESTGMLCSAQELELTEFVGEGKGLLVLAKKSDGTGPAGGMSMEAGLGLAEVRVGASLAELFGLHDFVLEIDNKSITHRPDLWSHYGFARELAMLFDRKLHADPLSFPAGGSPGKKKGAAGARKRSKAVGSSKKIQIEDGAAKAYYGVVCEGVRVAPSPLQMRARLFSVGQRPINNLVDASNYMMLESGQPNHVFDARRIAADTVGIRRTKEPADFTTLDGISRRLPAGAVLIETGAGAGARAVALGGIMGGLDSAVADDTTSVFLESATFHREDIRRTLSHVPLRTDSAVRFEKGQDPARAEPALRRLAELISLTCPDLSVGQVTGSTPERSVRNRITLPVSFVNARLGLDLKGPEVRRTLERLGFSVGAAKGKAGVLEVSAPSYRSQYDVMIPEDVVEEIGRVFGYDNIEPRAPLFASHPVPANPMRMLERRLKRFLAEAGGYYETNNYSFARVQDNERFGVGGILLKNPSFHDRDRLRVSLIPGLLRQAGGNQDRYPDVRLFELGRGYLPEPGAGTPVTELRRVSIVHVADTEEPLAIGSTPGAATDTHIFHRFLELRGLLTRLLASLIGEGVATMALYKADGADLLPAGDHLHPACRVEWRSRDGQRLATAGVLHPAWQNYFDLKRPAVVGEIDLDHLLVAANMRKAAYDAPSQFPESFFELSLLLDEHRSTADPESVLLNLGEDRVLRVRLLSIYQGAQLPPGKKSASYRISCGRKDGTLSGDDVQQLRDETIKALAQAGMPLR